MNISEINEAIYSSPEKLFRDYLTLFYVCRRLLQEQKLEAKQQAAISAVYVQLNSDLNKNVEAYKKADPEESIHVEDLDSYEDSVLFLEKQDLDRPLLYEGTDLEERVHSLTIDLIQLCEEIQKNLDVIQDFQFDYSTIVKELEEV